MSAEQNHPEEVQQPESQLALCDYVWYIAGVIFWTLVTIASLVVAIESSVTVDNFHLQSWHIERRLRGAEVPVTAILVAMTAGAFGIVYGLLQTLTTRGARNSTDVQKVEGSENARAAVETYFFSNLKFVVGLLFFVFLEVIFADYEHGGWKNALGFAIAVITSYASNYAGLKAVTYASSRVSHILGENIGSGFRHTARTASALAFLQVGNALFWLAAVFLIFEDVKYLIGFVFGKAFLALFIRFSTSNYNTSAINYANATPTSRNAAAILVNAHGVSAEYSETFVTALAAAALVGYYPYQTNGMAVPFYFGAIAVLGDLLGSVFIRITHDDAEEKVITNRALKSFRIAVTVSSMITIALGALPAFKGHASWRTYVSWVIGVSCAWLIRFFAEYYTSISTRFTIWVSESAESNLYRAVLRSLGLGLATSFPVVVILFLTTVLSIATGDDGVDGLEAVADYGLALAALGFASTSALQITGHAFAAIATTANSLEETKNSAALAHAGQVIASTNRGVHIGATTITTFAVVRVFLVWVLSQTYHGVDRHDFTTAMVNVTTYNTSLVTVANVCMWNTTTIKTPTNVVMPGSDYVYQNHNDRAFYDMDHMLLPGYTVNLLDKRTFVGLLFGAMLPLVYIAYGIKRALEVESAFNAKDQDTDVNTAASFATLRSTLIPFAIVQFVSIFFAYVTGPIMYSSVIFGAIFSGTVFAFALGFAGSTLNSAWLAARRRPEANAGASLTTLRTLGNYLADVSHVTALLKVLALAACILIFSTLTVCHRVPIWKSHCYDPRA
jgi:Na+/H+-translocating membrane pyrophosphatase